MREDLRTSSYHKLIEAKNNPALVTGYYNFVNAYQLYENGEESYGNICCMALDLIDDLRRNRKKKKK